MYQFVVVVQLFLSSCLAQMQCPTDFIFYEDLGSCLPKCISLDDKRNKTSFECFWQGNYSIPLNNHCDYSYQCRSGFCECQDTTLCMYGQNGFIANNSGICKPRTPCTKYPEIPNADVTNDTTILFDYKTNKTKTNCTNPYTNDICTFQCYQGYVAVAGHFQIKCTLDLHFDNDVITCEKCPEGFTNNNDYTKCVQRCLSNDDPRDTLNNNTLCLWNNGQIPNGYHCSNYSHCRSGVCTNNKCSLAANKEIVYEQNIRFDGKFIKVYNDITNILQCSELCVIHKLCTHFTLNMNDVYCGVGTSRAYSNRVTNQVGWISGYIRDIATFDIIFKHDLINSQEYFTTDEMLECNIDEVPKEVPKYSQLKYFTEDMRYKSVQLMYEFIMNFNGAEYHWIQNWDILRNITELQSMKEKSFTWISVNNAIFDHTSTIDDFEGIYQTISRGLSLLNSYPLNKHPIGWLQNIALAQQSIIWLAAKIQVIADDSWEKLLAHDVASIDSTNLKYYFDRESVNRINFDYSEKDTQKHFSSALYKIENNKDYLDIDKNYHFKLSYPNSIYQYDPIFWKQSSTIQSRNIQNFESMHFISSTFAAENQENIAFPTEFKGLKLINDNTSLLGTDENNNNTFRIGQYIDYLVCTEIPMKGMNISDDQFMQLQPKGGIIGRSARITHDKPRQSLQSISLHVRNQFICRDWVPNCWRHMMAGECNSRSEVRIVCRKSCKLCDFVSRTDLYSFYLGSSSVSEISTFMEYNKPFHRIPNIENIYLQFFKDFGSNISILYDQSFIDRTKVSFLFQNIDNTGWKDDIIIRWNVYEDHTPLCTYHNDTYCLSINRHKCSKSFYDNTCLKCDDSFIQYSHSQLSLNSYDKMFGAGECKQMKPDKIVVNVENGDKPFQIFEGQLSEINILRLSNYETSALGIGAIHILYTVQHWTTDDDDFGINDIISGKLKWENGDVSARTINVLAIDDDLFELSELFYIKFIIVYSDNRITLKYDSILVEIVGPNNLFSYRGSIEIFDENMSPIKNTTISVIESNITFTFYLKLKNSTQYCEVYYMTKQNTAIEGQDFMGINQSLVWHKYDILENNFVKRFQIEIMDDDIWELKHKTFHLSLYKSYGVSCPIDTISFVIIDNDENENCNLTEWSEWSKCNVIKGNQKIFRWKIAAFPDAFYYLYCENITQAKYCTNWDKSLQAGLAITPVQLIFDLNYDNQYKRELSIMLATPPNLTFDLGYNPYEIGENKMVSEINIFEPNNNLLIFYPKTVRFTVNSWYYPQSIFVTLITADIHNKNLSYETNLFPTITVISPDSDYFELNENRKSILGTLTVKIIQNQTLYQMKEQNSDNNDSSALNGDLFGKYKFMIIISIALFCVIVSVYIYRNKKRKEKAKRRQRKKEQKERLENRNKMETYQEYENDAVLEDLLLDE